MCLSFEDRAAKEEWLSVRRACITPAFPFPVSLLPHLAAGCSHLWALQVTVEPGAPLRSANTCACAMELVRLVLVSRWQFF